MIISRSVLLRMKNFSSRSVEKIKTHILCSTKFFRKSCRLWDNEEKFCTAGQDTDCNKAHAHWTLDIYDYKHVLSIWNTNCSTVTTVAQTPTLSVLFLSRFDPMRGHSLPLWGYVITLTEHITLGRTPLDEWKTQCRHRYQTTHNNHNRRTSMPSPGFEPTILACKRLHTPALDSAATGIGNLGSY